MSPAGNERAHKNRAGVIRSAERETAQRLTRARNERTEPQKLRPRSSDRDPADADVLGDVVIAYLERERRVRGDRDRVREVGARRRVSDPVGAREGGVRAVDLERDVRMQGEEHGLG